MNKRIIYTNTAGGVCVFSPNAAARLQLLEKAAIYQTVTVAATEEEPKHEVKELVTPAIYRDETDEEFLKRVALVCVPSGQPYKIVDAADIPADRSTRAAWAVDEADLTDGHGADWGEGSNKVVTEWSQDGTPRLAAVVVDAQGNHTFKEVA